MFPIVLVNTVSCSSSVNTRNKPSLLDITLGTLFDKYGDEEEAHAAAVADAVSLGASPPPPMTHVLSWGLGEVGLNDVNLASAGDGKNCSFHFTPLV